jgi:hypothetical protein
MPTPGNRGQDASSVPRKLKVLLPAADFRCIALDAPGTCIEIRCWDRYR